MKNEVVILYDYFGTMTDPEVVLFDELHDPMPYIKSKLKNWDIYDERFKLALESCSTISDAQILIDEYSIYTMQIHVIGKINPEVK